MSFILASAFGIDAPMGSGSLDDVRAKKPPIARGIAARRIFFIFACF